MTYDPEFEAFWDKTMYAKIGNEKELAALKELGNAFWKAAKAPKQEVKQLELEGGEFWISASNKVYSCPSGSYTRKSGSERKTKQDAEAAAEKMRKRDRLHAFATEFMGKEYEFKYGDKNWLIVYHHEANKWIADWRDTSEIPGHNYMTNKCAEYLRDALNDGRLVL